MLDNEPTGAAGANQNDDINPATGRPRRRAASRPAGPPPEIPAGSETAAEPSAPARRRAKKTAAADAPPAPPVTETASDEAPAKKTAAKRSRKRASSADAEPTAEPTAAAEAPADEPSGEKAPRKRKRPASKKAAAAAVSSDDAADEAAATNPRTARRKKSVTEVPTDGADVADVATDAAGGVVPVTFQPPGVVFQEPAPATGRRRKKAAAAPVEVTEDVEETEVELDADGSPIVVAGTDEEPAEDTDAEGSENGEDGAPRRRRRRGGRGRRGRGGREGEQTDEESADGETAESNDESGTDESAEEGEEQGEGSTSSRRRRRRRRGGSGGDGAEGTSDDPPNTVVRVREPREPRKRKGGGGGSDRDDEITGLRGSTRIEAKKQRRREGREAGRRRPPVLTESEFLARREAVERVMVIRQTPARTQIAVLEDDLLVEHHVSGDHSENSGSMVGNVYLGRVQNVLPSMEAAFVDIGRGRNAVLYAGEVNWDAAGLEGQPKRIEHALKSGDPVLVQVTKDPVGQKGARLTSQISLPGRYLVYVPEGSMNGISRKLPDTERTRLKAILKKVVPEQAGVIVRTAAEGATEEELSGDVERLANQWTEIDTKAKSGSTSAPSLLHGEPDLTTRVVRDIFNEDFSKLIVAGDEAWSSVDEYIAAVAPDLRPRLEKWVDAKDVFTAYRVDEQLLKALDRKVYLPSGGSLVIDRTEAMTVVDVNTGKFTGQGGNLEATVTENNLEAAEEIVRQLRLRDVGGIIVVDFIDMVLESNRDLVLRRLLECLGRDRTKHQVAEVTSLGLVQMTRKRVGAGLLEVFSETCDCCNGRGVKISLDAPKALTKADKKDAAAKIASMASAGKKDGAEGADTADAADAPEGDEKPKKAKKASRSRKKAAAAVESADPVEATVEASAVVETAGADAEAPETASEATDEAPAKAPRARRSRAKKAAAAPPEEA